ncbi:MAG: TlpA family protein disulfide reductase [Chloroflexota bacterium]|nr:TlpA family protein disulfide reductase [Chloroflexota bacterium]
MLLDRWRRPLAGLVAVAVAALLAGCGAGSRLTTSVIQRANPNAAKVGEQAPDFALPTPQGGEVSLSQFRGRPVVLYFWASWCGFCTYDLPDIAAVANRQPPGGPVIITVNVGEKPQFVERYVQDKVGRDYRFLVVGDTSLVTFRRYWILTFPTTFFVGRDGVIRDMNAGRLYENVLIQKLQHINTTGAFRSRE